MNPGRVCFSSDVDFSYVSQEESHAGKIRCLIFAIKDPLIYRENNLGQMLCHTRHSGPPYDPLEEFGVSGHFKLEEGDLTCMSCSCIGVGQVQ